MVKTVFPKVAAAAFALLAGTGSSAASTLSLPAPADHLLFVLQHRSGEYLFFIGAAYAGLLLLKKRRWLGATAAFMLGVGWLAFHLPVTLYLESLGVDSFAETRNFNVEEAKFWFQTLRETIYPDLSLKKLLAYLVFSWLSFQALQRLLARKEFTRRRAAFIMLCTAGALVGLAFQQSTSKALAVYLDNSEKYLTTARNFEQPAPEVTVARSQPDLLVYIGESTSVMNMGLYGYPRPTTPWLSERARTDANLVVFDHVFATHAHTSRSLLEALSLGVDDGERFLPITQRKRVSIVDLLNKAGVASSLISNQGIGGSWDQASSVVFKNARKLFRQKPGASATEADLVEKVWDHEFFSEQLDAMESAGRSPRTATFLHSYAGHGPYHGNIPESFRKPVDGLLSQLQPAQVNGPAGGTVGFIEEYDAAIRYVDYSLDQAIGHVQQVARPLVLVYFSDHGDAVFRGMGHDSARFQHEMARVPFMVYFNDAARREHAGLYEKYRLLARQKETSTLAQLPATLMDLLGVSLQGGSKNAAVVTPVIGEKTALPPIMVRDTADGTTFVNLNDFALGLPAGARRKLIDKTDGDTQAYAAVRSGRLSQAQACQAAPLSFEEASRRIMVAGCPYVSFPGTGRQPGREAALAPGAEASR
ncbi:MAG: hypothetical protein JWR74_2833 [Polaromonas sp.]|nr:hypothetical protein [Polaromonas sp.]